MTKPTEPTVPVRLKQLRGTIALWLVLSSGTPAAAGPDASPPPLAVGDALPAIALHDQNGAGLGVDAATRVVVFTRDMEGGKITKEAFVDGGREALAKANAVYLSDVSRMPALVRSMFAMPAMRKRPYPVAIDESGQATAALPWQEGKVTILTLENTKITAVSFAATSAEVAAALDMEKPLAADAQNEAAKR